MNDLVLPAQRRYSLSTVPTPDGALAVGAWRPRASLDTPDAPVVVALHGVTGNHRCWPFLADSLTGCRLLAPDLRGRGQSSAIEGPFGLQAHADDVVRLLDQHQVERAVIVGHSMGAFIATIAAHRHPDRVRSLVLVDGGLPVTVEIPDDPEQVAAPVVTHLRRRLETVYPAERDAVNLWRAHPAFVGAWSPVVGDYAVYDLIGRRPRLRSRTQLKGVVQDSLDVLAGRAHRTALDELRHPAKWLTLARGLLGEPPGMYSPDLLVHWVERYPQIEVQPVPGLNHYTAVLSRAGGEVMAAAVTEALDRERVGPRSPSAAPR